LAVQQYFPEGTQITRPAGGFILWISLPGGIDAQRLFEQALEHNISIAPGAVFSHSEQFNHCLRLNCGVPWNRETERAVMTLGVLAKGLLSKINALEDVGEEVA
jgi:DNA-binding transcriptional MocR family regulator